MKGENENIIEISNHNLPNFSTFTSFVKGEGKLVSGNLVSYRHHNYKYNYMNIDKITEEELSKLKMVIYIDIPIRIPIESKKRYDFKFKGDVVKVFHRHKKRGEENFSSFDTKMLPEFSSLEIITKGMKLENKEDQNRKWKITKYIESFLDKFLSDINEALKIDMGFQIEILNYELHYFEKGNSISFVDSNKPDFSAYVFYDGLFEIDGKDPKLSFQENIHLNTILLKERIKIKEYYEVNPVNEDEFQSTVDELILSFCYYCSNSRKTMSILEEERIRDLLLVPMRIIFRNGEGEAFNYDGKSDFKLVNPRDKFEYITGEFKFWKGLETLKKAFYQGCKKHSNGNEDTIYILMISNNVDYNAVIEQVKDFLDEEKDIFSDNNQNFRDIGNKKQSLYEFKIKGRKRRLRIIVGVIDTYFKAR